ncbi:MAG: hypothetical protein R2911_13525 [Caldilineaceae bacterium]
MELAAGACAKLTIKFSLSTAQAAKIRQEYLSKFFAYLRAPGGKIIFVIQPNWEYAVNRRRQHGQVL